MRRILIAITAIFLLTLAIAKSSLASSIISGISTNEIEIDTNFKGARILLFGAKGYIGNIVVVVRGPKKDFIITKKNHLLGVWYNDKRIKLRDSYSYYSLFSTFGDQKIPDQLLSDFELGKKNIDLNFYEHGEGEDIKDFRVYFLEEMQEKDLYLTDVEKVDFLNETLFKVMLEFPKNISRGVYSVDIYLIDDDSLVSFQSIPINVKQVGFSAKILNFTKQEPVIFGALAVFIAIFAGWFTNLCFCRFFGK